MLIGGLVVSLGLAAWVTVNDVPPEEAVVDIAPPAAERKFAIRPDPVAPKSTLPVLVRSGEKTGEVPASNLFETHSWYVPPPPVPKSAAVAEAPPKPTAPAVPYAYIGKLEDTPDGTLFMLTANNKVYTVKQGDVLDRVWQLEKEDAASLQFTYIPLALPKALSKAAKPAIGSQNNNLGMS